MLEIRPCCEHCAKELLYNATNAMICTFECTYCKACAIELFKNVCPNCNGGFVPRPIRPKLLLKKYPASEKTIYKPKDMKETEIQFKKWGEISPEDR